jgi:hypothetical protein
LATLRRGGNEKPYSFSFHQQKDMFMSVANAILGNAEGIGRSEQK